MSSVVATHTAAYNAQGMLYMQHESATTTTTATSSHNNWQQAQFAIHIRRCGSLAALPAPCLPVLCSLACLPASTVSTIWHWLRQRQKVCCTFFQFSLWPQLRCCCCCCLHLALSLHSHTPMHCHTVPHTHTHTFSASQCNWIRGSFNVISFYTLQSRRVSYGRVGRRGRGMRVAFST